MAKFKIVTQQAAGTSFGVSGGGYKLEMEGLGNCDAEIIETAAATEDEFIAAARGADALIAKGRPITRRIIDGLERCKVIALGSVGADSVDVAAATARGIPVTNVPDTFIEVSTGPGTSSLTLMLYGASSWASTRVNIHRPAFEAE